mmetsp:Transcript_11088/g.34152  ORF Transcript_11088/g.34152 Transcript_11088/m.34152 type:complete len:229 (+) Transcript_11088:460-1146(+)
MPLRADGDVSRLRHWAKDRTAWSGAAAACMSPVDTYKAQMTLILSTCLTKQLGFGRSCLLCRILVCARRRALLGTSCLSLADADLELHMRTDCKFMTLPPARGGLVLRFHSHFPLRLPSSLTGSSMYSLYQCQAFMALCWCMTLSPILGLKRRCPGVMGNFVVWTLPVPITAGSSSSSILEMHTREPLTARGLCTNLPIYCHKHTRVLTPSGPSSSARFDDTSKKNVN